MISTATNKVTATVTVGSSPLGVAVTPNGAYAYVTNGAQQYGFGDKYGYECGNGDGTHWKHALRCGCNAQRRKRLCYKLQQQYGFGDKHSYKHGDCDITVGSDPIGVAVTPNGEYAYVTNYDSSTVSVISTATNMVTATVPVGSDPMVWL